MRDLKDVIKLIKAECEDRDMMVDLMRIENDVTYTAPEMMYLRWDQVSEILNEYYEMFHKQLWFQKILSIFSTVPLEDVIKECKKRR